MYVQKNQKINKLSKYFGWGCWGMQKSFFIVFRETCSASPKSRNQTKKWTVFNRIFCRCNIKNEMYYLVSLLYVVYVWLLCCYTILPDFIIFSLPKCLCFDFFCYSFQYQQSTMKTIRSNVQTNNISYIYGINQT